MKLVLTLNTVLWHRSTSASNTPQKHSDIKVGGSLVQSGRAEAGIVLGPSPTWLERHAADELRRYLGAISGARPKIIRRVPKSGPLIAIGRPATNPLIAHALGKGIVEAFGDLEADAFAIKSTRMGGRNILLLMGSNDRGTLYAVYRLLEQSLGCGFFRDGEQIPRQPSITLPEIDIREIPRFRDRQEGSGCIYTYSTAYWTWRDWKRELDWKAKRGINIIWPFTVGTDMVDVIMAEWGVSPAPSTRTKTKSLHERAFEYAHRLGMRIPCILPNGALPTSFFEAYPQCRSIVTQWAELSPSRQLHPSDPMFQRLVVDYVRHYTQRYGTDHLYIAEFASESKILEGATDAQEARVQFARAMSGAIREADPEGIWMVSSWSFDFHSSDPAVRWTPEDVRGYLDAITVPLVVWDGWAEEAAKYRMTDYFYGRPWGYGVLHSFGGDSYLHGDVRGLIKEVRTVLAEPRADRLCVFFSTPEIIDYNSFYLELCAKLGWQPEAVSAENYLSDYCRHRYGPEMGKALEPAWRDLLDTVYGPNSGSIILLMGPLYWLRPNATLLHGSQQMRERATKLWPERPIYIPQLRHAIEIFLAQPQFLRSSSLARRDLVDIARQWNAERFNQELRRAREAFLRKDAPGFEEAARSCLMILDQQVGLLSSFPPYRLDRKVQRASKMHGDDATRLVKHVHLWVMAAEGQESEPLLDYYRMDLDGLVAGYYRPRVAKYLDILRSKMSRSETSLSDEELDPIYLRMAREFTAVPLQPLPKGGSPVAVVRKILASTS